MMIDIIKLHVFSLFARQAMLNVLYSTKYIIKIHTKNEIIVHKKGQTKIGR